MTALQHPRDGSNHFYELLRSGYYVPGDNMIIVGGTNARGRHGAGVAKAMSLMYGYPEKKAEGLAGRAYGIPTRDKTIYNSLTAEQIRPAVLRFVEFTRLNPDYSWLVTPVGTGHAGLTDAQMAPMFQGAINCWFTSVWSPWLEPKKPWMSSSPHTRYLSTRTS